VILATRLFVYLCEELNYKNMQAVKQPMTNLQLELLKLYTRKVSEQDLQSIKQMLAQYFSNKTMDLADKIWEKNNWTDEDAERFSNDHLRKSSSK
jgi:chromosome condensin MukBEF complex kleisin-like MukF subunit